jgi:uncharacterized protein YeaO (DUF488 family)
MGQEIAPSAALRKWFGHDAARWDEFRNRYVAELGEHPCEIHKLLDLARQGPITLVYSAHDEQHNDAIVLKDVLLGRSSH